MSHSSAHWAIGNAGSTADPSLRKIPGSAITTGEIRNSLGGFSDTPIQVYSVGAPATKAANNVAASQAVSGAGNVTINGALATNGVATLDVPRCVSLVSSNAGDTTQTATVTGTDQYGITLTSTVTFNGTTTVNTTKAFKTVTQVAISAALAGNLTVGTSDIFGLPYYAANQDGLVIQWAGFPAASGTFTAGVATSPATSATGDVRGTFVPASASNGTNRLAFWYAPQTIPFPTAPTQPAFNSVTALYGVAQA